MYFRGRNAGRPVVISESNITRCHANSGGGGLSYAQGAVVQIEDSLLDACVATGDGGGISSDVVETNELTMRRVTLRRCVRSGAGNGGGLCVHGTASLIDSHIVECLSGQRSGAFVAIPPCSLTMIGGSIRRCMSVNPPATSNAGAFEGKESTTIVMTGVEIADCVTSYTEAILSGGTLRMTHCRLLRLGTGKEAATGWEGALRVIGGSTILKHTLIEGHTPNFQRSSIAPTDGWIGTDYGGAWRPGFDPWDAGTRHLGCVRALAGTTTLTNVTLARCAQSDTFGMSAYLSLGTPDGASARLVGTVVNIVTGCSALYQSGSTPILQRLDTAGNGQLVLRRLRITPSDGCSPLPLARLLPPNNTIATCDELPSMGRYASCGAYATCTDVAIPGFASLTSAECTCTGSTFSRATEDSSADMLPYSFGCFTQRRATSIGVVGLTTSSLIFRLTKSATADETATRTLRFAIEGRDTSTGASWTVGAIPSWLRVPQLAGNLSATNITAGQNGEIQVVATTAGQPGSEDAIEFSLIVNVLSGQSTEFQVPVFLTVAATTVSAAWGVVDAVTSSCANATIPASSTTAIAGTAVRVIFVGCDRDGLKNRVFVAGFTANASASNAPTVAVDITHDKVTGDYAASFMPPVPGVYSLLLLFAGQPVAAPLAITASGCPDGFAPNPDEDADETCTLCAGERWALEGDASCWRCRQGFYLLSSGDCEPCPPGGIWHARGFEPLYTTGTAPLSFRVGSISSGQRRRLHDRDDSHEIGLLAPHEHNRRHTAL